LTSDARRCRLRSYNQAGFTLVEALVAITLLSLLSIALTGALRLGIDSWTRGSAHSDHLSHILAVQSLLRDIVGQAYPYFLSSDPTRGYVDFDGTSDSLALLAPAPIALGVTGRARFRLSVAKRDGLSDFMMTSQPELGVADASSTIQKKTLFAGAASIKFAYFGRLWSETAAHWHDHWSGQAALPQLVNIQVGFPQGDMRLWPDLVVAPRIAVDVGCVYDQLTQQCRGR
jgi:general secretion pathway protein J